MESVIVVRNMLDAWAGSRPNSLSSKGMEAPAKAPRIMSTPKARPMTEARASFPDRKKAAQKTRVEMIRPLTRPMRISRNTAIQARLRSKRSMASWRIMTARACWPVLPAWLATTGNEHGEHRHFGDVAFEKMDDPGRNGGKKHVDDQPGQADTHGIEPRGIRGLVGTCADHGLHVLAGLFVDDVDDVVNRDHAQEPVCRNPPRAGPGGCSGQ